MKRIVALGLALVVWIALMAVLWPSAPERLDLLPRRPAEALPETFPDSEVVLTGQPPDADRLLHVLLPDDGSTVWLPIPNDMDIEAMREGGAGLWYEPGVLVSYYCAYTRANPYRVEFVNETKKVTAAGAAVVGTVTVLTDDRLELEIPDPDGVDRVTVYQLVRTPDSALYAGVRKGRTVKVIYDEETLEVQWARRADG